MRPGRDLTIKGYVVGQLPNGPILVAVAALVTSRILSEGTGAWSIARAVFYVSLSVWAYLELIDGVNGFRRLLGAAGLAYVTVSLAGVL